MEIPEGTANCGELTLVQIFLTGLQPTDEPKLEQKKSVRRKPRQSRTVADCDAPIPHSSCTALGRGVGGGVWDEIEHGKGEGVEGRSCCFTTCLFVPHYGN